MKIFLKNKLEACKGKNSTIALGLLALILISFTGCYDDGFEVEPHEAERLEAKKQANIEKFKKAATAYLDAKHAQENCKGDACTATKDALSTAHDALKAAIQTLDPDNYHGFIVDNNVVLENLTSSLVWAGEIDVDSDGDFDINDLDNSTGLVGQNFAADNMQGALQAVGSILAEEDSFSM